MDKGISVIICCYNSAKRIKSTLQHLADQKTTSKITWEIVLVNNNSTDNTPTVAQTIWDNLNSNIPFKIVDEHEPGLSQARQKGVSEAKYDCVLFCDDDNWLAEDYIDKAFTIMYNFSEIGVLGGSSEPVYETPPPQWFIEREKYFAIGKQAKESGDVTHTNSYVWGAGSVYRKEIFLKIKAAGYKLLLEDRKGTKMTSGGDVELCMIAKKMQYKIWYDENLVCKHYMPLERFSVDRFHKLCVAIGQTYVYFRFYNSPEHTVSVRTLFEHLKFQTVNIIRQRRYIDKSEVSDTTISYFNSIGDVKSLIYVLTHYNFITSRMNILRNIKSI